MALSAIQIHSEEVIERSYNYLFLLQLAVSYTFQAPAAGG